MHEIDITPAQAHDLPAAEPGAERDPDERLQAVFMAAWSTRTASSAVRVVRRRLLPSAV
jgi:hypothetical protein